MSYLVLARKWRPQAFKDVVGQQHVLTALANSLTMGRIHHAWLFSGTRGVGKTTIARLLAKGLNCETGITATPCGRCDNCREIEHGHFVDLIEIDAASRTKVEDTRELLDNVHYAPARGRFKVYLIDEVHMLSRHSFNALLKTLEEPPSHVKFLLATTDPQKLPVTILSRCLQFHLQTIEPEHIREQLKYILSHENIVTEARAVQLLARAADGSLRDALSLTDQAVAMGGGQITALTVSQMLGTLDEEQPLALIEALAKADGEQMLTCVSQAASRGVQWDMLLSEMLRLLHRIAMVQLLPSAIGDEHGETEQRLRRLARSLPAEEVQLFYQTLLMGRKELALAPDRRMGVEMTLLRALAFHPERITNDAAFASQETASTESAIAAGTVSPEDKLMPPESQQPDADDKAVQNTTADNRPDLTSQLLQAHAELMSQQGVIETKKPEAASALKRLPSPSVSEDGQPQQQVGLVEKKQAYRWKAQHPPRPKDTEVATPAALRSALVFEKTPALIKKLTQESQVRDAWAAEIASLTMPELVRQLALNAWKEQTEQGICLHLRSSQRHLNTTAARKALAEAMSEAAGQPITLTIVEDDNPAFSTPLEWRQAIYEEKLMQARQSIISDIHVQSLCRFFDAELDEESIRPV